MRMAGEVNDMPEKPPEPTRNPGEFPKVTKIPGGAILQTAPHRDFWQDFRPETRYVSDGKPFTLEDWRELARRLEARKPAPEVYVEAGWEAGPFLGDRWLWICGVSAL